MEAIPCSIRLEDSWQVVKPSDNFLLEWLLFVDESTSAAALRTRIPTSRKLVTDVGV